MKPKLIATGIGLCFCLYGCDPKRDLATYDMRTYVPVYMSATEKNKIAISGARTTETSGKIYAYGNYIFQNDQNKGIHIIDNTDHNNPRKIAFAEPPVVF